jgi:hypothetical protein
LAAGFLKLELSAVSLDGSAKSFDTNIGAPCRQVGDTPLGFGRSIVEMPKQRAWPRLALLLVHEGD